MRIRTAIILVLCILMRASGPAQQQSAYRTIKVDTTEITAPALALSPDGRTLYFSALGQLFQIPSDGGSATQLTFGPSYNTDPAVAPDGRRIAFTSNRDGSGGNIFVLDLTTKQVTQLSRELEAVRPAWSPDGKTIAFVRNLTREDHTLNDLPGFRDVGWRELKTVSAAGGQPVSIGQTQHFETIFYLADGRLAWTLTEQTPGGLNPTIRQTRIEARAADGSVAVLGTAQGDIGRVVPSPKGDGVYLVPVGRNAVQWLPFGGTAAQVATVQDAGTRLAASADGRTLFFGDKGQIWQTTTPTAAAPPSTDGARRVPVTASITMEIRPRVTPVKFQPPPPTAAQVSVAPVMAPQLSPDGRRLVFMAAGFLWEQPVAGGTAQRLFESNAFDRDPVFSPDGKQLAFAASENGKRELRVHDFAAKQTKTLFTVGGASWAMYPSWSPDGPRVVFQHSTGIFDAIRVIVANVADATTREIAQSRGSWTARPHFSADGSSVYFTSRVDKFAALYRVPATPSPALAAPSAPPAGRGGVPAAPGPPGQAVTNLSRHVHEGLVSPDGKWMATRSNSEIWIAPMASSPVRDADLKRFSVEGGRSFSFAPDSSAILYAAGGHVWRQPVAGGARAEIPVRAALPRAATPPLFVSRVRVLDLAAGSFGAETSMLIQDGRIRWIGAPDATRQVPANAVRVDGGGRFAIPGLVDLHVHSAWSNQQTNEDAFIAFGVTSVRDTGGTLDVLTALDQRSRITSLPAPRYLYSGEIFEGLMPLWGDAFLQVGTEDEARAEARKLKAWGATFLKIYPDLPWRLQQVVADEGHRLGMPLVGHGVNPEEITRRVLMGFSTVEHNPGIAMSYDDIRRMMAASGTALDGTLNVGMNGLMSPSDPEWRTNWRVLEFVPAESRGGGGGGGRGGAAPNLETIRAGLAPRFERLTAAKGRGVTMLAGTDSLMGGVYFGLALHWEIASFVDAGFAPIDALRMATQNAAAELGVAADLGSLTPGKLADVVFLDANPLENIRNTQKIWQVVKGGRIYDPTKLRAR